MKGLLVALLAEKMQMYYYKVMMGAKDRNNEIWLSAAINKYDGHSILQGTRPYNGRI